jgi:hypothetical protein
MKPLSRLLPLLLIYGLLITMSDLPETARTDGARYLWFAENLTDGFYSPAGQINLWSGPGYPLMLSPVVSLGLPLITARLLNIVFMFGAAVYFFLLLRRYVGIGLATVSAYVLALWPPALKVMPQVMTEPLTVFLICGFSFHLTGMHRSEDRRWLNFVLASVFLGYLALTRVIFGYVIPVALLIAAVLYLIKRSGSWKRDVLVCCLSLIICIPYLGYTYSLTDRVYYWSTSGGMSLYWMSTPHEGELGDWHNMRSALKHPELSKNHVPFFSEIGGLSPVEKDDALKAKAIENIKSRPGKYFRNWIANLGRLAVNLPYSYTDQKLRNLLDIIPSMLLLVFTCLCIRPAYRRRDRIPHELWMLLLVGLVYLGGTSLLSAFQRFQLPLVPTGLLWLSFVVASRQ